MNSFFDLVRVYLSYFLKLTNCNYYPTRIWIETSSRCNLKCRFCVNEDLPPDMRGDMDLDLFKRIIDEISGKVYDINLFHRGEPLLNRYIVPMVSYAAGRGIKTRIHTNATLLDKDLSRKLILAGLDLISFSFDGYTKEKYEKNRSGANFSESLGRIVDFLKVKSELRSKKPYAIIQVIDQKEKLSRSEPGRQRKIFLRNFKNLPLNKIITRNPHNWGGLLELNKQDRERRSDSKKSLCTFPWYSLTVFYDGRVFLCPQDFEGKICLGSLSNERLSEIFNGKIIKAMRDIFISGEIENVIPCNSCDRIRRKTFLKIPLEYLGIFIKDRLRV
ncbi:MAG: radical SAM/SPASM domain-containing protein [Actinomycetota bacterium]|nr:radical SAM/SPASM domain-containing protein [Actinomycetota bacterium]